MQAVGKGRPRFSLSGSVYTPSKTKAFEHAFLMAFKPGFVDALRFHGISHPNKMQPIIRHRDTDVHVEINIMYRTDDTKKRWLPKNTKPDIDNIGKAVLDALDRYAWCDEKISELHITKRYGNADNISVSIDYFYKGINHE